MRLFFAGSENKRIRRWLAECKVQNVLLSYYYIKQRKVNIQEVLDAFPLVAIDSGGFTMYQHTVHKKETVNYVEYLDEYLDFIQDNIGKFFWAANYDIEGIVGLNKVLEWNKEFQWLDEHGQDIVYVAHDTFPPYRNLYHYFDRYNYIGVTGGIHGKEDVGYFEQVYNLSLKYGKFVHGFGMTNFVLMNNFPFYTTDSTTYLGGAKFGSTYVYNGAYFETWDYFQKHRRKALKNRCALYNVDYEKFVNDDVEAVTKFNIYAWLENEKIFNRRTRTKQWWATKQKVVTSAAYAFN